MKNSVLLALALILFPAGVAHAATPPADSMGSGPAALPAPLDLKSAIGYALEHNYEILQARERIRQQEGLIMEVKSREIPNVGATGQYQRNKGSISTFFPPETALWSVQVKATQALFAGGGIDAAVKGAKYQRDAAVYDLQGTINSALLEVRTRFYDVLLAREKVRVQEENIGLFQRQLQDAQSRSKAGATSNFEVLRAQVALANAQPDLITARNAYRIAIEQLRQSLGVPSGPAGTFPEITGSLDYTPENYDLDAALASAREHRPELLRLDKLRDASEESVRGAKSTYYPDLSLFGTYEWLGVGFSGSGDLNANGWLVGLQSSWAIFDGRATAGRVRQTRSLLNQARLSFSSTELAIDVEVHQSLSALQEAAELVGASQKTVEQATEALRLANARYQAGSATQLDVLTSQVSLTQARTNQLQANYNYIVAAAATRKAIGLGDVMVGN